MTPKVERTSAPRRAAQKPAPKKKAESKKEVFENKKNNTTAMPSEHLVEKGQTAFMIARKYGITIHELAEANGWTYEDNQLKSNGKAITITEGSKLKLPGAQNKPKPESKKENKKTYTVKKGDSFKRIAENHNISIRQLAAANGLTVKQDKNGMQILKNGKPAPLDIGTNIIIPPSVANNLSGIKTLNDVKSKTKMSDGFINVIKKYESNPKNNFEPYTKAYQDSNGVWTIGYGHTQGVNSKTTMTTAQVNQQFAKDYMQIQEDLRIELGNDVFNKMPAPIKDGVIDLIYNKGFTALDTNKFKQAINNGDVASAVEQLIFTKSIKTGKDMNGLFSRSLARISMVYDGLDAESKKKVKPIIDKFYATAKTKVNETELSQWWNPNKPQGNPQVYQVKSGETFTSIAKKHGISVAELEKANPNIDAKSVKIGENLVIPRKNINPAQPKANTKIQKNGLSQKINNLKLKDQNSYNQVLNMFNAYAKTYKLPQEAQKIFKQELDNEYDSWFYINADNLNNMASILEAQKPKELIASIQKNSKASSEVRTFTGLALKSKITKDNAKDLIKQAGGTKEYVNLVKKTGDFDVMLHTLQVLLGDSKDKNVLARFNEARKKGNYNDVINIYNQVLAQKPSEISGQIVHTLDKDDNLNSKLYQYQMGKINEKNVLDVLRSNDIITGICEAENDRSQCKSEILKLISLIEKNYELNPDKKQEFMELIDKEFRPRSANPSTWWIATSKISEKFKTLISNITPIKKVFTMADAEETLFKELKLPNGTEALNELTDKNGNIKPLIETFKPTKQGKLSGKRIVINSGHGGYNPTNGSFDPGATGDKAETKIHEWSLNRLMSQRVIKELQEQGATVILTSGHINSVSYLNNLKADMTISLHADSHSAERSGPGLYVHPKDSKDKKLANNILDKFVNNEHTSDINDFARNDKLHKFKMQTNNSDTRDMQIVIHDGDFGILRQDKKTPSKEPSILVEYCNIQKPNEIIDIVTGNLGKDMVKSIVDGIIDYWNE